MKSEIHEKATASLHLRVRPSQKEKLLQDAKEKHLSLTEFILLAIHNKPADSYDVRKEFITSLHLLSYEINRIGNNINQSVHLMHQDKLTGNLHVSSVQQFNANQKLYNELKQELKSLFQKIIEHEQAGI